MGMVCVLDCMVGETKERKGTGPDFAAQPT